ncbi:uncharacterized protein LOC142166058 [Nicotiana tabacum]|uniref:Uncharacterized protein LOC142166058 n=1 Tax=Nicotiana tabacum TaxID=4097 RepID=A0AC58S6E7_TOBAC
MAQKETTLRTHKRKWKKKKTHGQQMEEDEAERKTKGNDMNEDVYVTVIYAKCSAKERKDLWESLENISSDVSGPWCIGGYVGARYTWSNNRRPRKRIWKRLDRILVNDQWTQKFQHNYVRHLVRTGYLSKGSREKIGDIYEQFNNWEAKVQQLEELDLYQNTEDSREELNKAHVEYIKWLYVQENLLREKSQIKNRWVQGDEKIAKAAVKCFERLFDLEAPIMNISLMYCIPSCISTDDNDYLAYIPDIHEVKEVVFNLSAQSASSLDGFNGVFYQTCWEVIKEDIMAFVQAFFNGRNLTKFYSHSCLVLVPKVESPSNFSKLRPISLTNLPPRSFLKYWLVDSTPSYPT